ncbi:MAG: glycosyltransferase family 1 protein, partial [Chitinophagaceae bacterium]
MRIGFDAKRYFLNSSGLGNYSRDLVRILETNYPDNTYIKYTPKVKDKFAITDNQSATIKLPQSNFGRMFPSLWRRKGIVNDLKRDQIDIFHGLSGEIPLGLAKANVKSVVSIHDLIFLKFPELYKKIDRNIYNSKFKHAVNNADQIVAISEQTKTDIVDYYAIPQENITVIYQGCHPSFKQEKTQKDKAEIRQKYKLPSNFLLNVGSIEPRKNALQIVKAITNID